MKVIKGKEQLTLGYGKQTLNGEAYNHKGIDIVKHYNQLDTVIAIEKGTVIAVVTNVKGFVQGSYGNYVYIQHDNGFRSFYAHLSKVYVKKGQSVSKSQKVGEMGATGYVFGAHLHFEIEKDRKLIDPTEYVFGSRTFNTAINKLARTTTALNVRRKEGSIYSKKITTLPKNTDVYIIKQMNDKDGYEWYMIYYNLKKGKYQNGGYVARNKIGSKEYYFKYL